VFRHSLPDSTSRLATHDSHRKHEHAQPSPDICSWNSEHASTARPNRIVGAWPRRILHWKLPKMLNRKKRPEKFKTPAAAYQRKTGIYNTLHSTGQTK